MALQGIIQQVHVFQKDPNRAAALYQPGAAFDPNLADTARAVLNRMGQEERSNVNKEKQQMGEKEKEKEKEVEDHTYSIEDLWKVDPTPLFLLQRQLEWKKEKRLALDHDIKILGAKIAQKQAITRPPKKLRKAASFEL